MIAFVRGQLAATTLAAAVVEVGGVGLQLHCTPNTLAALTVGELVRLPTSLVVREDSLTLYGFLNEDEKTMFEMLQTASGVGPKVAQTMLAVMSPDSLRNAILNDDPKALTQVPGVGQKGAQRIILELKDRLTKSGSAVASSAPTATANGWQGQVLLGLTSLGWSQREAEAALAAVSADAGATPDVARMLRAALQTLGKAK
jgi:holliday junction DNA helicase RuvA